MSSTLLEKSSRVLAAISNRGLTNQADESSIYKRNQQQKKKKTKNKKKTKKKSDAKIKKKTHLYL